MTNLDRDLGAIQARLSAIEQRLTGAETDMRELTRTTADVVKAVASLTAKVSVMPTSTNTAVPAGSAAAVGATVGAAIGSKLAVMVFGG